MSRDTLYEVLNVPSNASAEEIRAAFRRLSVKVHPDQGGSNALFRSVKDAYDTLSDPRRRADYDRSLSAAPSAPSPAAKDGAPGWVGVNNQRGNGWATWSGGGPGRPPPRQPQSNGGGPNRSNWPRYSGGPASAVSTRPAPELSFIAQHPAATAAVSGAAVLVIVFAIAFDMAGPVVFIAPALLLLMALVALAVVRSTAVTDWRRRAARRRFIRLIRRRR